MLGRRARLRWVHLLLGGALSMPFYLLASTVASLFTDHATFLGNASLTWQLGVFAAGLVPVAVVALHPLARPLQSGAARALRVVERDALAAGGGRSWAARGRTAAWCVLHLGAGGIVSGMSLATPPAAVFLMLLPVLYRHGGPDTSEVSWLTLFHGPRLLLAPVAGLGLLAFLAASSWVAGALLARCAPVLLGPTAAERLAAAEEETRRLALRNRLARELHDSVGHALSAVTLQASAARRLLDRDPDFVRQALTAIEETTRTAVAELDAVLGVLREDGPASTAPAPTLGDLPALLDRARAAGGSVELTAPGGLDAVPAVVSREAYRIVQEGLTNALRHAGPVPVRLRIAVHESGEGDGPDGRNGQYGKDLEVTMENPARTGAVPARRGPDGGGRGLPGIAERARLLRGTAEWGEEAGRWRLAVRLPLRGDA
ncbi:histidine kinase [Streptomyces mashuensis]|uniref:histidine kinase n=1 Tax=Streptomyces mashuensis TaxID=33904 RepID=A0A919EGD6_9ACTN|nr:histidine kinase [Streptomyces mashuensis]